jgi:hypothetical protein
MSFTALEVSTSFAHIWFDFAVGRTLRSDVPLGVSLSTVDLASGPAQATLAAHAVHVRSSNHGEPHASGHNKKPANYRTCCRSTAFEVAERESAQ